MHKTHSAAHCVATAHVMCHSHKVYIMINLFERQISSQGSILLLILFLVVLNGCTVIQTINRGTDRHLQNHSMNIETINREIENESILIRLTDGRKIRANKATLSPDHIEFQTETNQNRLQVNTDSIEQISYKDRLGGVLDAALISILPAVFASISTEFDVGGGHHDPEYGRGIIVYGLGFLAGFAIEKEHVYQMRLDSTKH